MLFFLLSIVPFLLLLSKPLPLQLIPSSATEAGLLFLAFVEEFLPFSLTLVRNCGSVISKIVAASPVMASKKKRTSPLENAEHLPRMSVLDLPELALECILGKLPPAGLCSMAGVCRCLREKCRSDYLWERHMREKWGMVVGSVAQRQWHRRLASRKEPLLGAKAKPKGLLGSLSRIWPLSWLKLRLDACNRHSSILPDESTMSWYLSLEKGKVWFSAQVYNREHGHIGFMLSCYDAELCYDCRTDTFHARYPPHGRRTSVMEEEVRWERVRMPPVDTMANELHVSDCLHDLHPGDHIEIQWRRSKEFPYGWWYGNVGHLEPCDGNELYCRCKSSDTVVLEFNQYTHGSRWRRTTISRRDHREEGNETDGFYGGIRKLYDKDEISRWKQLWPSGTLE